MDVKVSIAAIKDAITKSAAERTSPEVISAAYAVVHLIGGVLLASARLLGAAGPFGMAAVAASGAGLNGVAALIGAAIGYIISCGLCRQHTLSCRYRTCLHDKLCVSGHKACVKKRVRACNGGSFRAVNRHSFELHLGVHSGTGSGCRANRNRVFVRRLLVLPARR